MKQTDLVKLWSLLIAPQSQDFQLQSNLAEFGLSTVKIFNSPLLQTMLLIDLSLQHHHWSLNQQSTYVRFREADVQDWGKWRSCDILEIVQDK